MISVVIPTLNDEARLGRLLAALVPAAVEGVVTEVVIADGGSSDATLQIADDAGCRIVQGEEEQGRAAAKGPWLLELPPGARLQPGWIDAAKAHVEGGAAGSLRLPVKPGVSGKLAAMLGGGAVLKRKA